METTYLRLLASKNPILPNLSTTSAGNLPHVGFLHRQPSLRITCTDSDSNRSTDNGNITPPLPPPPQVRAPITPPETVGIRFNRRSRRKRQLSEEGISNREQVKAQQAPKKWEDMSIAEKAVELYLGEKGLLFWLNKFAYASIFIVIGGWIVFRFVGPALNLYQLDSPPLPPSSMFK